MFLAVNCLEIYKCIDSYVSEGLSFFIVRGRKMRAVARQAPAARGLEELFSTVLERFLEPIHDLRVYCKN